ncbi:glycosyltransferase [Clostridium botulinum]|nr:glycosyltransferase [Clostridium botulinum]
MLDLSYIDKRISYLEKQKKNVIESLKTIGINIKKRESNNNLVQKFSLDITTLKELRVACVMDRFTLDSFSPECTLLEVTPNGWKEEIENFNPHMLFIESAWKGKDDLWYRKIVNGSKEYFEMTTYCQEKNIPIVFWNKEDPIYTDQFMITARMADFIFTTDIDCIKTYKDVLKHDNVYHLHFAAQPKYHNPIEKYERKDKYCFAGAYYHKYVERCKTFNEFSKFFIDTKGFDIYDRNYKCARPEHAFPKMYDDYIIRSLDPSEIDIAYKGYNYGINMNSVHQSQTMFARRLFEMLASNTVTVGNYSRGVKNYFGDLTICTNDGETLKQNINKWCSNTTDFRKYRLLGLRKVLSEHLYEDRLSYIVEKVFNKNINSKLPLINIISKLEDQNQFNSLIESFKKQKYSNKRLYVYTDCVTECKIEGIKIISTNNMDENVKDRIGDKGYITVFNPKNYYGENYLLDTSLSTRYGDFNGIGKKNYYYKNHNGIIIDNVDDTYKNVDSLKVDRAIFKIELFKDNSINNLLNTVKIENSNLLFIGEFNFCENLIGDSYKEVDDTYIQDNGLSIDYINKIAENIKINSFINSGVSLYNDELFKYLKVNKNAPVTFCKNGSKIKFTSVLDESSNYYINIQKIFNVKEFLDEKHINIIFSGISSLECLGTCIFYDNNNKKISPSFTKLNAFSSIEVPENAEFFNLSLRFRGSGEVKIDEILIGSERNPNEKACFLSRSKVLVLTNHYPSSEALYRNMFVHKRMTAYKKEGYIYDVMRMNIYAKNEYRDFEGINVVEGQADILANILEKGDIDTVCVHFLDKQMWEVLKGFKNKVRIIVWLHGAEIQPWWRREYNYNTEQELNKAKIESEERMEFWAGVFSNIDEYNIHFIFVSQYFANEIFEDNKIEISKEKYTIIHNCIDTDMFNYIPKSEEQRKKILSIRPYASNKYANDLSVKAIMELTRTKGFKDMEFRIIGNGELFDETLKPLKKYKNIKIEKNFLRQEEISELHKQYGIFLTPTRMDAQGVSRDEAMSSGLVPITNAVTAIPEFVDEECGILVDGEDYMGMAKGIKKLYDSPDYFLHLSKNAAERIRKQTSKEFTINKEINVINNTK